MAPLELESLRGLSSGIPPPKPDRPPPPTKIGTLPGLELGLSSGPNLPPLPPEPPDPDPEPDPEPLTSPPDPDPELDLNKVHNTYCH